MVETGNAVEGLAHAIRDTVRGRLRPYGIAVEDVSLREIRLPDEVMKGCIEACKSYYNKFTAERTIGAKLKAEADVIGKEAVAMSKVVGSARSFVVADVLNQYLQQKLVTPEIRGEKGNDVGIAAIVAAEGPTASEKAAGVANPPEHKDGA